MVILVLNVSGMTGMKESRGKWIFCAGMLRSGSTLQYQIVSELIETHGYGYRMPYYPPEKHSLILTEPPEFGMRTFKTHILSEFIRKAYLDGHAIVVYTYRDIRDVIASLQKKYNTKYDRKTLKNIVTELIEQDKQWREFEYIYITNYEKMVINLKEEIRNHAKFLGINCDESFISFLADYLSYNSQIIRLKNTKSDDFIHIDEYNIYNKWSLIHKNHFQGGKIGRFKEELEKWQINLIEDIAGLWLQERGYL